MVLAEAKEQEGTPPKRPEPKRTHEQGTATGPLPLGKLGMVGGLAAVLAYGYFTHSDDKLKRYGFDVPTTEPWITLHRVFSVPIAAFGRVRLSLRRFYAYFADPPKPTLLPSLDLPPGHRPPLTLVIDLDDTLVHTDWSRERGMVTRRRPHCREFLQRMAHAGVEIVVFSSTSMFFTDGVVAALDPKGQFVHHRLGKEYTVYMGGAYVKDLSRLNRDLSRVVIVDDNPDSYRLHPANALPIAAWGGDKRDTALRDMGPFLEYLAQANVDVRDELRQLQGKDIAGFLRAKTEKILEKQRKFTSLLGEHPMHRDVTAADVLHHPEGGKTTPAPSDPSPPSPPGRLWAWLRRKNDESLLEEQRLQEEWSRKRT